MAVHQTECLVSTYTRAGYSAVSGSTRQNCSSFSSAKEKNDAKNDREGRLGEVVKGELGKCDDELVKEK